MKRSEKLRKRPHDRARRLVLAAVTTIAINGCATPQRSHCNREGALSTRFDDQVASIQACAHDENLIESFQPPDEDGTFAPIANQGLSHEEVDALFREDAEDPMSIRGFSEVLPVTTAACVVPTAIDAPEGDDIASPSDRELPIPVSIPFPPAAAEPAAVEPAATESSATETAAMDFATITARSVDDFIQLALSGHPSILAARHRVTAVMHRIPQARALPDPAFNNMFWPIQDQALQTAAGRIGNQMSLTQSVPWPEKLKTKAAIVSQEVQIAKAELEAIEREITESVRLAYYEVWFATRAIEIVQETQQLVQDLTEVAEARYRSGGTQQDVLRAQLESDRLDEQLTGLIKQKRMAQADLAALVQQPLELVVETTRELSLNDVPGQLDELVAKAEQCNPKLKGLAWEIQRDRQKQRLACLQQYPDLQFGLHWGLVSDGDNVVSPVANGHDNLSFNVGTTLPIWRNKIRAGVSESVQQTGNSMQRLEAERDALRGQLRRLLAQAEAFHQQREIYRQRILPRTEDTLRLAIADYRGKRTDFFSLIETYRELLMFETQLARLEANLAGSLAQIDRVIGCPAP